MQDVYSFGAAACLLVKQCMVSASSLVSGRGRPTGPSRELFLKIHMQTTHFAEKSLPFSKERSVSAPSP
eukprot:2656074-Amphidinium_carterae.1